MKLHFQSVAPGLLDLLQRLMKEDTLKSFALAGGTALALRFGHRTSIDIDLFTCTAFDATEIAEWLKMRYGMNEAETAKNTVRGIIHRIKTDWFAHKYKNDSLWNVEKSLTWFEDADPEPDPRNLRGQSWEQIKQTVLASTRL